MSHAIILCLCAFALLGVMPFGFFRRGRPTAGWLLTASPFFVDAGVLLGGLAEVIEPAFLPVGAAALPAYVAIPLAALSIGLTSATIGVHRAPVSMWHQDADLPHVLVTSGPYRIVRHPFYASFIIMLTAAALAFPHPVTVLMLIAGTVQLYRTARREERRLLKSPMAADYADYMQQTGRLLPGTTRRRAPGRSPRARHASTHPAS